MAKKDTIIGAAVKYFEGCPVLTEREPAPANAGLEVNADNLPEEIQEYCIEAVPCKPVLRQYVDGSAVKQFEFIFASREAFGAIPDNLGNSAFFEAVADWLEAQSRAGNLPVLPKGLEAQKLEVLTNGYVMDADETKARYQIQCRLRYYQPAKA